METQGAIFQLASAQFSIHKHLTWVWTGMLLKPRGRPEETGGARAGLEK